jgi:hypothetical protein
MIYTLDTSESGTRVGAQSPPVCNVTTSKIERVSRISSSFLTIFVRSIYDGYE